VHTLIATVPTAANAGYYADIVAEKAVLRRLIEAGARVVQYGYAGAHGADVDEVVDRAQAEIYDVIERRTAEDYVVLEDLLQPTMDEIDAIASNGGLSRGVPTGFTELDHVTNALHPGQIIIVAARPGVGKSTLALDFLRSCSIRHRMASVIFSLEMSKSEIVMRLLAAEARIKLAAMRSGRMSSPVSSRGRFEVDEALECLVLVGVVGGVVLPAVPDDVEPGAGEDADGVGVVVPPRGWLGGCRRRSRRRRRGVVCLRPNGIRRV
jgi:replicative DNA helicase